MAKRIVLLSDGTGNSAGKVWRTNVWRFFQTLDLTGSSQVAFYDDGVGSSSFKPAALLGGAFGWGLKRNVLDIYKFACRNYKSSDDKIYGFGFSRGAFTMRVVIGLILNQGIIRADNEIELSRKAKQAYRAYRRERFSTYTRVERIFRNLRDWFLPDNYQKKDNLIVPKIEFLGLWDTVAAYGLPVDEMTRGISRWLWPLELPDNNLSDRVVRACHALSLDDERTTFHPVLWNEHPKQPETKALPVRKPIERPTTDDAICQVWFAGVHSNVGGGYPDDSLAHIPLMWIMEEAKAAGLTFKASPASDPDAFLNVHSTLDKDGRLYDSRSGLGGYYRYGPRKLRELCCRTPPDDKVVVRRPKIHESVLQRISNRAHLYAPTGIPARYEIVTANRTILPPDKNPYQTPAQAYARARKQEHVWNLVWKRRVVYFLTVAVSLGLVLWPLIKAPDRAAQYSTYLRQLSDLIAIAGAVLPGALSPWLNAYIRLPELFIAFSAAIVLLVLWSAYIDRQIKSEMASIWAQNYAGSRNLAPSNFVYWLRTRRWYRATIKTLKFRVAPFLFALAFVYYGATLLSHALFTAADSAGLICESKDNWEKLKPVYGNTITIRLPLSSVCYSTGYKLLRGQRYLIEMAQIAKDPVTGQEVFSQWTDGGYPTALGGYRNLDLFMNLELIQFSKKFFLEWPLKRSIARSWFTVIARVGRRGNDEEFLDYRPSYVSDPGDTKDLENPQLHQSEEQRRKLEEEQKKSEEDRAKKARHGEVITARRNGELFLYVNDAVIAFPWLTDFFYKDNEGLAIVTIRNCTRERPC